MHCADRSMSFRDRPKSLRNDAKVSRHPFLGHNQCNRLCLILQQRYTAVLHPATAPTAPKKVQAASHIDLYHLFVSQQTSKAAEHALSKVARTDLSSAVQAPTWHLVHHHCLCCFKTLYCCINAAVCRTAVFCSQVSLPAHGLWGHHGVTMVQTRS